MSRTERAAFAANAARKWRAAIPALGLAVASLAGCAQAPTAKEDTLTRGSTAGAGAGADSKTSVLKTGTCAKPEYPKEARRRGSQGTTTLRFLIDTDGSVARSDILKSSGDASLDEAARSALAKCRFTPAVKDSKPHPAWVPVQYVWLLAPAHATKLPPATPAAQP